MATQFGPVFLYIALTLVVVAAMLIAAHAVGPRRRTPVKDMPYESGMDPVGDARKRFDVRFYLIAILFLVFDVELLFLYPWAVVANSERAAPSPAATAAASSAQPSASVPPPTIDPAIRNIVFIGVMAFIALLTAGLVYEWRRGVFQWQ